MWTIYGYGMQSFTITGVGVQIIKTSAETFDYAQMSQQLFLSTDLAYGYYSCTVRINGVNYSGSVLYTGSSVDFLDVGDFYVRIFVLDNRAIFDIVIRNNGTYLIEWVTLVSGSIAPSIYVQMDRTSELAICQSKFIRLIGTSFATFAYALAYATNRAYVNIPLPVSPYRYHLSNITATGVQLDGVDNKYIKIDEWFYDQISNNSIKLQVKTVESNILSIGQMYQLTGDGGNTAIYIDLEF